MWLDTTPSVTDRGGRRVDDTGVLGRFLQLGRPAATVQDLARFVSRHGWLPLKRPDSLVTLPARMAKVLLPTDEATPEDIPIPGLTEEHLTRAVVPARDGSGEWVHPLIVYQRYAQVADYILRGSSALAAYDAMRGRARWAAILDGSALEGDWKRLLDARSAAAWLGAPLRSLENVRRSRAHDPADTDRHAVEYCLRWWFRVGRLQVTPTWAHGTPQLEVVPDDLWGVLALEVGRTLARGEYAFCRKCGVFYLRVASAGPRGGRPALLCSDCYTAGEGRRIAARRAYQRRRKDRAA